MGSSPIARSNFLSPVVRVTRVLLLAAFLQASFPLRAFAQMQPDLSRPWQEGQVVHLPSLEAYLGDLAPDLSIPFGSPLSHSLVALEASRIGIPAIGTSVHFEGIAYPGDATKLAGWLPPLGSVVQADFPLAAWFGPSAAGRAWLLQAPLSQDPSGHTIGSSGTGGTSQLRGDYRSPNFSFEGSLQHEAPDLSVSRDILAVLSRVDWVQRDDLGIETGLLVAQWLAGDSWYSFHTQLRIGTGNFQSLKLIPFFQRAQQDGAALREYGAHLDYHFTLGGLVESQVGTGWSRREPEVPAVGSGENRGFLQNSESLDLLGMANLYFTFREDFSDRFDPVPNLLIGLKGHLTDEWFVLGDHGTGGDFLGPSIGRWEVGVGYQFQTSTDVTVRYLRADTVSGPGDGARAELRWGRDALMVRGISLWWVGQVFQDPTGTVTWDWSGRCGWEPRPGLLLWVQGRKTADQPWLAELGTKVWLDPHLGLNISLMNLGDLPFAWPDPAFPPGRVFEVGLEGSF